jgi:hypothetical protein
MKKNRTLLIILLAIVAVTAYFFFRKTSGTIDEGLRDFAFKDTASISKIFLADRTGAQVTLEKKGPGNWMLSDGSEARNDAMNSLLVTIRDVSVRSPVSKAAYNNVVRAIATKGAKIEIYTNAGLAKTYYIGGPTQDQMGTFMHLEGSSVPFVTHIPGFNGYLTPRYITKLSEWKTKRIFRYKPSEITELTAYDREIPGYHIRIVKDQNGDFTVTDSSGKPAENISQDKVVSYFKFFGSINYESEETSLSSVQRDSMLNTPPFRRIAIKSIDGRDRSLLIWKRPQTASTTNKTNASGMPFPYDIDRMTARLEGDTALIVIQYYVFDKLFRKPADFQLKQ